MTNPKRYDWHTDGMWCSDRADSGKWVSWEDYEKLQHAYDGPPSSHKLSTVVGLEMFPVGRASYDETPALLPCPCCGSTADYCRSKGSAPFRVECSNCGLNTGFYRKSGQAAAIWNNRPKTGEPTADSRDAARYRWLRDSMSPLSDVPLVFADDDCNTWLYGEELDKAVDSAIANENGMSAF